MPKKKAAGGKKKKAAAGEKKKGEKKEVVLENAGPTELELTLRMELDVLEKELVRAKAEAEEARRNNQFLQDEAQRTEEEMREYESYMGKKTQREHTRMQSLSETTQREIDAMEAEKQRRRIEYEDLRKTLNAQILEKEAQLHRVNAEIDDLAEFEQKRAEQDAQIEAVTAEIKRVEAEHAQELQMLKSRYLDEKIQFQKEASSTVLTLEQQASKEASTALAEHSETIRAENKSLRKELLGHIQANRELQERERMLRQQNKELIRQMELNVHVSEQLKTRRTSTISFSNSLRRSGAM